MPGKILVYNQDKLIQPYYIINFPTKRHWRDKSRLEDIQAGLKSLAVAIDKYKIKSIAIPALGCGLGGLDWRHVQSLIMRELQHLNDVYVIIYKPKIKWAYAGALDE